MDWHSERIAGDVRYPPGEPAAFEVREDSFVGVARNLKITWTSQGAFRRTVSNGVGYDADYDELGRMIAQGNWCHPTFLGGTLRLNLDCYLFSVFNRHCSGDPF